MSVNLMLEHQVKVEQLKDELRGAARARRAARSRADSAWRDDALIPGRLLGHPLLQEALRAFWSLSLRSAETR